MKKPPGMTDQQYGEFLAECAMGGPYDDPPLWGFVVMAVAIVGIVIAHLYGVIG